jgi:hypothetical protein
MRSSLKKSPETSGAKAQLVFEWQVTNFENNSICNPLAGAKSF